MMKMILTIISDEIQTEEGPKTFYVFISSTNGARTEWFAKGSFDMNAALTDTLNNYKQKNGALPNNVIVLRSYW